MSKIIHADPHPSAGAEIAVAHGSYAGQTFRVEDWWDRVAGVSWMDAKGNPAALKYAARSVADRLPFDDQVLYGKFGNRGDLVHVSEFAADDNEGGTTGQPS